jgi:protein involved in polysaccharide export with SLBB domain
MFAAIAIADAHASTNESGLAWPAPPLYPSQKILPATPAAPAASAAKTITNATAYAPGSVTQLASTQNFASTNTGSARAWPAIPLTPNSTSKPATTNTNHVKSASAGMSTNSAAADNQNLDNSHILEPGDQISFQILEDKQDPYSDRKDPINLTITDSSEVDVPFVGRVAATGKTCQQLAADVKTLLEKDYYFHATVVIGLNSINKIRGQAFICGLVRTQGSVDIQFNHDITAGEAILMMGGLDDFADKKQIRIIRNHDEGGVTNQQVFVVNMQEVLEQGKIDKDIVLQPGDFVIVPARVLNF